MTSTLSHAYIAEQFSITIRNKYQVFQDMKDPAGQICQSWGKLKTLWMNTSEGVLGRKKQQNKAWISNHTISKISQKRSEKKNLTKARTRWQKETTHAEYTKTKQMSREDATSFKYLGSAIKITGGTD